MFFLYCIISAFWIDGGILSIEIEKNVIPFWGIGHRTEINESIFISQNISYWEKGYVEKKGTYDKKYKFSKIGLSESILFRIRKRKAYLECGVGIGINLLKNYVEESYQVNNWKITQYYALNSMVPGFHTVMAIYVPIHMTFLFFKFKQELILTGELASPFYTNADIKEISYSIGICW